MGRFVAVSELQRIVDSLATRTDRAVSVHDRGRRLLAFSAHGSEAEIDPVRQESILTRRGPERGFEWAKGFGIETESDPVRVPSNSELGMTARICCGVRFDDRLLGYLWLMDPEGSFPDASLDLVRSAADAAAFAIHRDEMLEQIDRGRERELLRDLLSDQADLRAHAVNELIEHQLFTPSDLSVVYVVKPTQGRIGIAPDDSASRDRLERALAASRADRGHRQLLHLVRPDHGVVLATFAPHERAAIMELGAQIHERVANALKGGEAWATPVGVGDVQTDLASCHTSYKQARQTADVCALVPHKGPVARWSDLGAYQTLLQLPLAEIDASALHPGLVKVLHSKEADQWVRTLEVYLDLGCDARAAAKQLFVSKSTLYHRLHRIEQLAGVDLTTGDARLSFHLGLRLARLAGMLDHIT